MNEKQADRLVAVVKRITLIVSEKAVYALSPDPEDNYLFDLAIQNNCAFIVSDDS